MIPELCHLNKPSWIEKPFKRLGGMVHLFIYFPLHKVARYILPLALNHILIHILPPSPSRKIYTYSYTSPCTYSYTSPCSRWSTSVSRDIWSWSGGDTNTDIPIFLLTFTDYHCWLCHDFCGMNEENHHCWRNGKYGLWIHLQNTWNPIKSQFYYSFAQWKILRYLSPSLESEKNYWDFFLRILYVTFLPTCVGHVRHV